MVNVDAHCRPCACVCKINSLDLPLDAFAHAMPERGVGRRAHAASVWTGDGLPFTLNLYEQVPTGLSACGLT